MSFETDLERTLRSRLGTIELPAHIPTAVARRAHRRRGLKLVGLGVGAALVAGLAWAGALRFPADLDIRPAAPKPIPFKRLPVRKASKTHGLVGSPLAPPQFPDCTQNLVDIETRTGSDFVGVDIRPHEGVQCGLDWWSDGFWTDATGEIYKPPRASPSSYAPRGDQGRDLAARGQLLLMGTNGAQHAAQVADRVCSLQPPITYSIMLADETIDVGTIDVPVCQGRGSGDALEQPYFYQLSELETPMAFLDPHIDAVERETPEVLRFILTLVNDTDESIVTGRCPFYDVTYVTTEGKTRMRSYLNCPAAPDEIEPEEEIRFSIQLPLRGLDTPGRLNLTLRDERRPLHRLHVTAP